MGSDFLSMSPIPAWEVVARAVLSIIGWEMGRWLTSKIVGRRMP